MNILQVKVNRCTQNDSLNDELAATTVPVIVPELEKVRTLAQQLHVRGQEFKDILWGWSVQYEPEIREENAEYQIPTQDGSYRLETRPFWSPASFTIGESGVWFFSMLWEKGRDQTPTEFLDQQNILIDSQYKDLLDL